MKKQAIALLKTMRPKQWTKNGVIFAALVFDQKIFNIPYLLLSIGGFLLFCLISGVVYIINDLVDLENDRQHPRKRLRPLAAGEISPRTALIAAILIGTISMGLAIWINGYFAALLGLYLILQLTYSFYLKNMVLIDVLTLTLGFVIRVGAGVPLVQAMRFSPWLYLCTTFLALFLALGKRRGELVLLGHNAANHRKILQEYNLPLLDQLISMVTTAAILSYTLYTFSAENIPDSNHVMMLTIIFVIYGMFRYLYLIHVRGVTLAPDEILLTDRPLQIDMLLWGLMVMLVFYLRI